MKFAAVFIFLIALSAVARAGDTHATDAHAMCRSQAELAKAIMSGRQAGVSMAAIMDKADEIGAKLPAYKKLWETMITQAYEGPRYATKEMQERTIEDFRDNAYLACIKAYQ